MMHNLDKSFLQFTTSYVIHVTKPSSGDVLTTSHVTILVSSCHDQPAYELMLALAKYHWCAKLHLLGHPTVQGG